MHVMANHYVMKDGADYVYMHLHLYHPHTHYLTLRINKNLTSTSGIIVIIRHNFITASFHFSAPFTGIPVPATPEVINRKFTAHINQARMENFWNILASYQKTKLSLFQD